MIPMRTVPGRSCGKISGLTVQTAKATLRGNTDEAIARGVFGVPTVVIGRELFWGVDALPLARAYLSNPNLFQTGRMAYVDTIANPLARLAPPVTAAAG
jgi:hypothetical protein